MAGVTLDTGVFIAVERRQRRALALWEKWALTESAAQGGDTVYTSDFDDMARLATRFPGVRVLGV